MKPLLSQPRHAAAPDALRGAQLTRLRRFLKTRVLPFSAFYRRQFAEAGCDPEDLRRFEDLAHLPFTTKDDLVAQPKEFVLTPDPVVLRRQPATVLRALTQGRSAATRALEHEFRPLLLTSTTGRSSQPVPFLYTHHDLDNLALTGHQLMEIGGSQRDWRHVNVFPFAPHLAFWQTHYAGIGFGCFLVGTGGGRSMGTESTLNLIEKVRPEVLIGMPTFLYHLLRQAVSEKRAWPQLRKLVLGGEKAADGLRRKLRSLCGELGAESVEVLATYGFTEAKMAWIECPAPEGAEPSGYHTRPELSLIEIIDPETGQAVAEHQPGEIVFSALDSRGTVVIRYRTGDRIDGGLSLDRCPHCGRLVPRLVGTISRVSDIRRLNLAKLKGTLVDFNALEHALDDLDGLGPWQIELRKHNDDPFECDELVVHASSAGDNSFVELENTIRRRFFELTEVRPNSIQWHTPEELRELHGVGRALKEEKIIDSRPRAPSSPAIPRA